MAATKDAEEQPAAAPKTPRNDPISSASSFPQSFPVIDRNFSNASSVFTDMPEAAVDVAAGQEIGMKPSAQPAHNADLTQSSQPNGSAKMLATLPNGIATESKLEGGGSKPTNNATQLTGQVLHKLSEVKGTGKLPDNDLTEDDMSVLSNAAVDGSVCSAASTNGHMKHTPESLNTAIEMSAKDTASTETPKTALQTADSQEGVRNLPANHAVVDLLNSQANAVSPENISNGQQQEKAANETTTNEHGRSDAAEKKYNTADVEKADPLLLPTPRDRLESKSSSTSLSPISEPFVPSNDSSKQATPRHEESKAASATTPSLNVNAAAFVPSFAFQASPVVEAADPGAGSVAWQQGQLKFGSLPESLNASPHLSNHDQQEWPIYNSNGDPNGYHTPVNEEGFPEQGHEWQTGWEEEYQQYDSAYADGAYIAEDGTQYYQQVDGTWVTYCDQEGVVDDTGTYWQGHYEGESYVANGHDDIYANGGTLENGCNSSRSRRGGRSGRRGGEQRRNNESRSWQSAAVDVLEQQFHFTRGSLHEMLDLHEGNLEVALNMLAQLEAEMDGQLPASGQDAPELNEENFPSLSSPSRNSSPSPATAKAGFAEAVRATAAPSTPPGLSKAKTTVKARTHEDVGAPELATHPAEVPWKETGAAVSEAYAAARAVARDHARLRNTYFQEATKAYLAGQKALAKELGAKGREESELMKAAHVEASQAIYKHRNPQTGRGKGRGPGLLDLHGLHVKEAIAVLESEIASLSRSKPRQGRAGSLRLCVLVGTGHHTKGSRTPARLPAGVEEWLHASQISYTHSAPGLLELSL